MPVPSLRGPACFMGLCPLWGQSCLWLYRSPPACSESFLTGPPFTRKPEDRVQLCGGLHKWTAPCPALSSQSWTPLRQRPAQRERFPSGWLSKIAKLYKKAAGSVGPTFSSAAAWGLGHFPWRSSHQLHRLGAREKCCKNEPQFKEGRKEASWLQPPGSELEGRTQPHSFTRRHLPPDAQLGA